MKSQILVDYEPEMCSVALLEEGVLNEFYVEHRDTHRLTGNIYKGKVINTVPGLSSAFVDIGLQRNGFLAAENMLDDRSVLSASGAIPTKLNVKAGDEIIVQATKEEVGQKGARLTANISLPGHFIVYMPTIDFVGVSNKITDVDLREKLTKLLKSVQPIGGGFIARTACLGAKKQQILDEVKSLQRLYKSILERSERANGISLLYNDGGLIFRTVRDMINSNVDEILCNNAELSYRLKTSLQEYMPKAADKVHTFNDSADMYTHYNVLSEVDKILRRKVELKCGGTLYIDYTEALTAIDVNSARYLGNIDREETVFKINLEAAAEIMRQLRLRNVGGIIVIDFIDMASPEHCNAVVEKLKTEAIKDRTRTRVTEMTELGLVQMTRKKTGSEISSMLLQQCQACKGSAHTQSPYYLALKIKSKLNVLFFKGNQTGAIVTVNNEVFEQLASERWFKDYCVLNWKSKRIYLAPSPEVSPNSYNITATSDNILTLPARALLIT